MIVLTIFKLYNRVWTFASVKEIDSIVGAVAVIELLFIGIDAFSRELNHLSYYLINYMILTIMNFVIRFSKRMMETAKRAYAKKNRDIRIMIVGVGSAGTILIRKINAQSKSAKPVCAIDDSLYKQNKYIFGVPVVGTRNDIVKKAEEYNINENIIAMLSVRPSESKNIVAICRKQMPMLKFFHLLQPVLTKIIL